MLKSIRRQRKCQENKLSGFKIRLTELGRDERAINVMNKIIERQQTKVLEYRQAERSYESN